MRKEYAARLRALCECAVFLSCAMVLSYIESLFPLPIPLPPAPNPGTPHPGSGSALQPPLSSPRSSLSSSPRRRSNFIVRLTAVTSVPFGARTGAVSKAYILWVRRLCAVFTQNKTDLLFASRFFVRWEFIAAVSRPLYGGKLGTHLPCALRRRRCRCGKSYCKFTEWLR